MFQNRQKNPEHDKGTKCNKIPAVTDEPTATKTPAVTDEPTTTDTPTETDEPTATETPSETGQPTTTDTPTTDNPTTYGAVITLSDDGIAVDGTGATAEGSVVNHFTSR